jgi:hypothetical protein
MEILNSSPFQTFACFENHEKTRKEIAIREEVGYNNTGFPDRLVMEDR